MRKLLLLLGAVFLLLQTGNAQFGTLKYHFYATDGSHLAVGCDANNFYTSTWLGSEISRYNMEGTHLETFSIGGVSTIRDFTHDGNYFYVVNQSMTIYKLDLNNKVIVGTIPVSCPGISHLYHISYDPTLNGGVGGFWVGDNYSLRTVSLTGAQLSAPLSNPNIYIMGSVYDPYSNPATPYLWIMTQVPGGFAIMRQFDINAQALTSFSYGLGTDHPECAGNGGAGLCSYIDINRKFRVAANVQTTPNIILVYELVDLMEPGAPGPVTNFTVTPDPNGDLGATLMWTNPTLTYNGQPLTQITAIKVYQGNTLIHTFTNAGPGGTLLHFPTVSSPGFYTFTVIPENTHGTGTANSVTSAWIGHDVPAAPTNPNLVLDNLVGEEWTVTASWTAPTTGLHGGFFSAANLVYDVYRMPDNILVSNAQNGTTFTETIATQGTYHYVIKAKNHIGDGASAQTPELQLCLPINEFPWLEQFSDEVFPPVCWNVFTPEGHISWLRSITYLSSPYGAQVWSYDLGLRETWLVTPEIALPQTGNFILEFQTKIMMPENYDSGEIWISTQSNDPADGNYVLLKQLVKGVDLLASWKQIAVSLEDYLGTNIYIGFRYLSNNYNNHYAWFIDDIGVRNMPSIDATAKLLHGALTPMVNEPFIYKATIENLGSLPLTDYSVKLIDENDNVLAVSDNHPLILTGETAMITMHWTPTTAGNFTLYALVDATGDADPTNDKSAPHNVTIQPYDPLFEGKIGNGTTHDGIVPFGLLMRWSLAQSLYFDHEIIGRGGAITKIQYFNNFNIEITAPIEIWMANTMLTTLDTWVPQSEFTLVFEGEMTFPIGQHTITFDLDVPFTYTGDNLIIMSLPVGEIYSYPGIKNFYNTYTPDFPTRSLSFFSNWFPFNWAQPPTPSKVNYHANTIIFIENQEMGSVSGTVTSNGTTPVEGATVEIIGSAFQRTTNANGEYSFDFLTPGEYQFKASKFGYIDATSAVITVTANENSVVDFIIEPNPLITVSGKVIGNDAPAGLANVVVTLSGYETYTATTNATGDYLIADVYDGHTYTITATLEGYQPYSNTIEVNGAAVTHNITLNEIAFPPLKVVAEIVGDNVLVTWGIPGSGNAHTFRYDSGINAGQVGWGNGTRNSILGAAHRNVEAELYNMSWFSTSNATQPTYDLWVLGINDAGLPDRKKVIYTVQDIPNTPNKWCTYEFPEPLYVPHGFFMGVSPSFGGFTSIGTDFPNAQYPFVPNGNLLSFSPEEEWECFSVYDFNVNAMIRADGVIFGKSAQPEDKSFTHYKIYRLLKGQESNESAWTVLSPSLSETNYTDVNWLSLSAGVYRYAVKAEYTGGITSVARFSNALAKDMEVAYTINLTNNAGDPVTGAIVTLTNVNGDPNYVYKTSANSNVVTFPAIWKGTYNLSVTLTGFHPFTENNISIQAEGLSKDVELIEIIKKPFLLKIETTNTLGERYFTWNNTYETSYWLDDGSGEDGYSINNGWDISLGNKFEVGEAGNLTSVDVFSFNNLFVDIFGSRTVTVDIYDEDRKLVGKTEPFHLANEDWINVPLNNTPYSGTFYALVHWYPEGDLPTHFLGADEDGPNAYKNLDELYDGSSWYSAHIALQIAPCVFMIRANAETTGALKSVSYDKNTTNVTGMASKDFANAINRMENPTSVNVEEKYIEHKLKIGSAKSALGYNVYLNGEEKGTHIPVTEYFFTDLVKGNYTAGVKSVYTSGESEMATIDFVVHENSIGANSIENVVLFPNPFTNEIHISHPELVQNIRVTDVIGKEIKHITFNGKTIGCGSLSSGIYFVEIESFTGEKFSHKLIKE